MSQITIKTSSICDKAGRPYNQDNFWICPDLSQYQATNNATIEEHQEGIVLSDKGALLVVADGMGGMNAGEVASQIIIDSVKQSFLNTESVALDNDNDITGFIKKVIVNADENIKKHAVENPETAGMGSTIVLAWFIDKTVFVGWCGDSRAYCFNEKNGIVRLSHDHSYVQSLVDNDDISEEDAFDHPNSNIITRSLGDSGEKAKPEIKSYPIHNGDIFLLCTDGLCGVLRDSEIEEIMSQNHQSIDDCLKSLWINSKEVGWTDNVTIELAQIVSGGSEPDSVAIGYKTPKSNVVIEEEKKNKKPLILILSIVLLSLLLIAGLLIRQRANSRSDQEIGNIQREIDSLSCIIDSLNSINDSLKQSVLFLTNKDTVVDVPTSKINELKSTTGNDKTSKKEVDKKEVDKEADEDDIGLTPIGPATPDNE